MQRLALAFPLVLLTAFGTVLWAAHPNAIMAVMTITMGAGAFWAAFLPLPPESPPGAP